MYCTYTHIYGLDAVLVTGLLQGVLTIAGMLFVISEAPPTSCHNFHPSLPLTTITIILGSSCQKSTHRNYRSLKQMMVLVTSSCGSGPGMVNKTWVPPSFAGS